MTQKDITQLINSNPDADFLKSVEITLDFKKVAVSQKFKGINALYAYIQKQKEGWNQLEGPLPRRFRTSESYFNECLEQIEIFLQNTPSEKKWETLVHKLLHTEVRYGVVKMHETFTYNAPVTQFLLKLFSIDRNSFKAAYDYLFNSINHQDLENKSSLKGILLAYEFEHADSNIELQRSQHERKALTELRNDYDQLLKNTQKEFIDTQDKIATWFKNAAQTHTEQLKKQASEFDNEHYNNATKIKDLEQLYANKLMLSKPADYWEQRATALKKDAQKWIIWLTVSVVIAVGILLFIIFSISNDTIIELFSNLGTGIKWSIVFISIISFLAFAIKIFSKLAFSAYHLARDAEERKQLVYVYLSLLNDNAIAEEERIIILQSLFSRSETGLLKEESSPTMPSASFLEKAISKP